MFLIDYAWVELLLPYKDRFRPQCHLPLYLSPSKFMFPLRVRNEQIISYEWLLLKSEPVNYNFGTSAQEFSGLVLYNFEEVLTCSDVVKLFSEVEPFFQILKFEYGCSRFFRIFSLILKKKKKSW